MLHKFSTWIVFASSSVNFCSLPFSFFSFPSLVTYKQITAGWIKSAIVCCHNCFFRKSLLETEHRDCKSVCLKCLKTSSESKQLSLNATTLATSFLARFAAKKNAGCTNASHVIARFLTYSFSPTGWHLIPFSPLQRVYGRRLRHNQIFSDG